MPAFNSVRGTEDYLTSRAANPRTGLISPSVYAPTPGFAPGIDDMTSSTPRTPGEALAFRGDFSKTPDRDERRPSGAEMLNEYFGLGKKTKKFPVLKRRDAGSLAKAGEGLSGCSGSSPSTPSSSRPVTPQEPKSPKASVSGLAERPRSPLVPASPKATASEAASRPNTPHVPASPKAGVSRTASPLRTSQVPAIEKSTPDTFSDTASIVSSERDFTVGSSQGSLSDKSEKMAMPKERVQVPIAPLPQRSGTLVRVAAYWSGVKKSLQSTQPVSTPTRLQGSPRLNDADGAWSPISAVSPMTKVPTKSTEDLFRASYDVGATADSSGQARRTKFSQLPSVRLVHPALAAQSGIDRRADRVVDLPELMKQAGGDEGDKDQSIHFFEQSTIIAAVSWLSRAVTFLIQLLVGPLRLNGTAASGGVLEGIVALVRLLILAYLAYCSWLVLGLVADVIRALCWPFRIVARFVEWSVNGS